MIAKKQVILYFIFFVFISCLDNTEKDSTLNNDKNHVEIRQNDQVAHSHEKKVNKNPTPVDIALTFINSYVDNCNKMKESIGIVEWVDSSHLTTKGFKSELNNIIHEATIEDPELGLDFDPILDGQDYPEEGFELVLYDAKTNLIIVKGKKWADFRLTMKLVLENNQWLIDGCGIINIPQDQRSKR